MNKAELQQRTKSFALALMRMVDLLPRSVKGRILTDQIVRSSTSVASGYRAACRARSRPDWVDKIGRVLEEIDESLLWIELIEEGELLPPSALSSLRQEADELTAIFVAIHRSSKS